jgi:hypothetical protein
MKVIDAGCPLGAKCEEPGKDDGGENVILRCPWYTRLAGKDPQSGQDLDHWACAIAFLPTLLIENSNQTRMGNAAIDKLATVVASDPRKAKLTSIPLTNGQLPKGLQDGGERNS